jgi:hypothetical protein
MEEKFKLATQPADYQISVHLANLTKHFTIEKIMDNLTYILESREQDTVIDTFLYMHKIDLCAFRCAQLVQHYTAKRVYNFIKIVHPKVRVS